VTKFWRLSLPILFWTVLSSACFGGNDYARSEGYPVFDPGQARARAMAAMGRAPVRIADPCGRAGTEDGRVSPVVAADRIRSLASRDFAVGSAIIHLQCSNRGLASIFLGIDLPGHRPSEPVGESAEPRPRWFVSDPCGRAGTVAGGVAQMLPSASATNRPPELPTAIVELTSGDGSFALLHLMQGQ
jgi:hypothetical protein